MAKIINLTPLSIDVVLTSGETICIPSSGIARCSKREIHVDTIDGIKITRVMPVETTGLPDPKDGTIYIVSREVADAERDRDDLMIPGDIEYNQYNEVIGYKGLRIL